MTRWMLIAAAAAAMWQGAAAHTQLSGSMPADRAVLESAPAEIVLDFSEPVRLTALSVQPAGSAKRSLGPLPTDAGAHFAVDAPTLEPGDYTVSWRALSQDTHVMTGEFSFSIGAAAAHGGHAGIAPESGSAGHAGH